MGSKLFEVLVVACVCHSTLGAFEFEFNLDTHEDLGIDWRLNRNRTTVNHTHWFAYFDSLEDVGSEAFRFKTLELDLSELGDAVGVWAAFHVDESRVPFPGLSYPEMILFPTNQILHQVELTYYVCGNGEIHAVSSSDGTIVKALKGSDPYGKWRTERFGIGGKEQLTFVLQTTDPGDCVLVDKIIVTS